MTKKNKLSSQKRLAIAGFFAISIALLFMISSVPAQAGTGHQQETSFTSVSYIPNPTLNSNVSWSVFHNNWKPLEYNNGTGNQTLNAGLSQRYENPITVNPADLVSNTLEAKLAGKEWQNPSNWTTTPPGYTGTQNTTHTYGKTTINGQPAIYIEANASKTTYQAYARGIALSAANLPSSNLAFDYLTISGNVATSAPATTSSGTILIGNSTKIVAIGTYENAGYAGNNGTRTAIQANNPFFLSVPLSKTNLTFTSGTAYVYGEIYMPSTTATTIENMTITGMALSTTTYSLGVNNNSQMTATLTTAHLSQLAPNFPWTSINNDGYTVAVSQSMQNETISQTSINNGVYTEEATYQGILTLPNAPDLSYSNSIISMKINLTGKQYLVANLNGISYLSSIQKLNNGTFTFTTVNANSENSIVIEAEYTTAQWTASSGVPSFWTIQGIEYYWYIFLGGALGLIGLGTSKHAQTLRVGKK